MKVDILGINIDKVTFSQALKKCCEFIECGRTAVVFTPNPEIIANSNEEFKRVLNSADLCVADGIGVVYASWILRRPLPERVAGCDLAFALLEYAAKNGVSVFLLGAKPGIAKAAAQKLQLRFDQLSIVGFTDGYFKSCDNIKITEEIRNSRAQILFVCLGAKKQEKWILDNRAQLPGVLCLGLGGVLDIFSGAKRRAPKFFISTNLEWLYRLVVQPSRLKRYLALPKFVFKVLLTVAHRGDNN